MNHFQHFLNILFSYFEEKKVAYCVLHSYESLPEYAYSDVDMAIDFRQRKRLDGLLHRAAKESGFRIVQKICQDIPCCQYYALTNIDSPKMDIIKLDFLIDDYGLNKYCLPSGALLERRVRHKNFYVPPDGAQAAYLLIKKTIKEKLTEENMKKLRELYISNSRDVALFLEKYFGKIAGQEASSAIRDGNREKIIHLVPLLREEIKKSRRRIFIRKIIWSARRMLSRVMHPTGELIVILSPDGGGKSSMAKATLDKISDGFFWKAKCLHWRPGVLPKIRTLIGKPEADAEFVIANPHSPKKRSRISSFLRWLYYSFDYIIGHYLKILPMKIKTTAVVMDRYYYDIVIDPVRYGFNLPNWLLKLPLRFIPKPDLTIYLDNEPEELYKRKQELPVSELRRQVEAWREFIPSLPNARIVTTNKPLYDVVHEVTKVVLERRAEMTRKMLTVEPEASQYIWGSDVNDYIALPSKKNCRWIIPKKLNVAKKAWDLYQPYSLKGKFYRNYQKYLSRINPFASERTISSHSLNSDKSQFLKNRLIEILGTDDIVMALSTGTPSPFRKITGLVMSSDGTPRACIKIGETSLAISRIKNESIVLKKLAMSHERSTMRIRVPDLLYEGEINNGYMLIQSPMPFEGKNGRKYFNKDYQIILEMLTKNTSITKNFNETDFCIKLKEGIDNYSLSYKSVLKKGLDHLEKALGNKEISFALSHGDFAPWNMIWSKDKRDVFIYDWESANPEAPAGIDLIHFLFQAGFLLKKLRGEKLFKYILQNVSLSPVPLPASDILVLLYSLHMAVAEDEPQQLSPAAVERRTHIKLIVHS